MGKKKKAKWTKKEKKLWKEMAELFTDEEDSEKCKCIGIEEVCDICQDIDPINTQKDNPINYYFELMDRIHIIQCSIDDHIIDHHILGLGIEEAIIKRKLHMAQELLAEVYQWACSKHTEYDE